MSESNPGHCLVAAYRRLVGCAADFGRDQKGAVAIFVAAAIIPLIAALGLATDAARGYMVKARLQQAIDAAALAGGKGMFSPNRDADVQMFFDVNFPPGYMDAAVSPLSIAVDPTSTYLTVTATATIEATFMRVLGFDTLTVAASTQVMRRVDQLDLVLSIDMSGSMCSPCTKIEAAQNAALTLVDILFGTDADGNPRTESPTLEVDGKTYNLLNVGLVPWNTKVNITNGTAFSSLDHVKSVDFTNPVTGASQSRLYYADNAPSVPLLNDPDTLPGGWSGCVYARYVGDADNANDADLSLGPGSIGGKQWLGWEPAGRYDSEPRDGRWRDSPTNEPGGSDWAWKQRVCTQAVWNGNNGSTNPPFPDWTGAPPPSWHAAAPKTGGECGPCLSYGITSLKSQKQDIVDAINALEDPDGGTDIPQGLAWAWEVLMPGEPFDEAVEDLPFARQRAIVLLTDGEIQGSNGDAYKGRFGSGTIAGFNNNPAHGYLPPPAGPGTQNNLNNRLIQLAENIKAMGIKIYVIQFDINTPTITDLLKTVASEPNEPFYYYAPDEATLELAFKQIASNLSKLRLSK